MGFKDLLRAARGPEEPEGSERPAEEPAKKPEPPSNDPPNELEATLTRQVADSTQDVFVSGAGVDGGGVDVLVPGDSLSEPDIASAPVDVGDSGVPEMVESEVPIELGDPLPLAEQVADAPSREPVVIARDEQGSIESERLAAAPLPAGELPEFVDESIGYKDMLRRRLTRAAFEDLQGDPALDGTDDFALASTGAEHVSAVERADLEFAQGGAEGDGDQDVIPEPVFVVPSHPKDAGLLGVGEGDGRAFDGLRKAHELPPGSIVIHEDDLDPPKKDEDENNSESVSEPPIGKAPLAIIKRNEQEFEEWIASEIGFLTQFAVFDDGPLILEPYQLEFLACEAPYRCVEKSRQVGYSWVFACEAIARSHLRDSHNSIFVSYNLSDSKEKIAYAAQLHEELPLEFQKKKVVDSKLELGFQSNSGSKRVSRIISHPSRAPRGKKGDIYLDELAHYANDREVYKGSTALILRARGQMTVCSSPLGRRGMFWEVAREEIRPYPTYWRQKVPWWLCSFFCVDVVRASAEAPNMDTEQRVRAFGTKSIGEMFGSMPLEDFQQEFEVMYIDESMSFFPYELILPCTNDSLELAADFTQVKVTGRLTAGFDVGRRKDLSELALFDEQDNGRRICRGLWRWDKVNFSSQEAQLRNFLDLLPIDRLYIDQNGIGMHLAENLSTDYPQVVPHTFSSLSNALIATDFKILLQRQEVVLPRDRELVSQIHSIRKRVTAAGRVVFEVGDSGGKGHADRFWACALACQKERIVVHEPAGVRCVIVSG